MPDDLIQLTDWGVPGSMLDTQYGRVNYRQWLIKERLRLKRAGIYSEIQSNPNGQRDYIALFRTPFEKATTAQTGY